MLRDIKVILCLLGTISFSSVEWFSGQIKLHFISQVSIYIFSLKIYVCLCVLIQIHIDGKYVLRSTRVLLCPYRGCVYNRYNRHFFRDVYQLFTERKKMKCITLVSFWNIWKISWNMCCLTFFSFGTNIYIIYIWNIF